MKYHRIKLVIYGVPMAKQSTRFDRGYAHKDPKIEKKENDIRLQVKAQLPKDWEPLSGTVRQEYLLFVYPRLKKHYYSGRRAGILRPDARILKNTVPDFTDNLPKLLYDALKGIVITDDKIVASSGGGAKIFGDVPRIEIELCEVDKITGQPLDGRKLVLK